MFRKQLVVVSIILSSFFLGGCSLKKSSELPETSFPSPTPFPTKPIEESLAERPFVSLVPSADNHWLTLDIRNITKGVSSLEYELIYFAEVAGSRIERGVSILGSPIDLNGQAEFSKKILLGTASCTSGTCKYKYDEGVNEGTLTLILNGDKGREKYETAFRIQKGKEGNEGLTTGDGVFSFVSSSLSPTGVYLTISSLGVPVSLPAGVIPKTIPYGIFSSAAIKNGTVAFKTSLMDVSVYGFDGKVWSKLDTTVGGGEIKATSVSQNIFILAR